MHLSRAEVSRYGAAIIPVAVAFLVRSLLNPYLDPFESPFVFFAFAIAVAAHQGGRKAGLLATLLSLVLSDFFFVEPGYSLIPEKTNDVLLLAIFTATGTFITFLGERLDGERRRSLLAAERERHLQATLEERQRVADEKESSRRKAAMALEAAKAGTWEWDLVTGQLTWSEHYDRLLGVTPGIKPSMELFLSLVHPEDRPALQRNIDDLAQRRLREFQSQFRILRPDGTRWFERRGQVICDDSGKPLRVVGLSTDITDRIRAEAAAAQNRAQLGAVLESLADGVIVTNAKGEIVLANRAAVVMHGWDNGLPRLTEYLKVFELTRWDGIQVPASEWPISRCLQGETVRNVEARVSRKDTGRTFFAHISGVPIRDASGSIVQIAFSLHDVTEAKVLRGLLATCARCKKIRDRRGQWQPIETYITQHSAAKFSHGLCPDCERVAFEQMDADARTGV